MTVENGVYILRMFIFGIKNALLTIWIKGKYTISRYKDYIYYNLYQKEGGGQMANVKPSSFVLRCYGYKFKNVSYTGVCVDLNIAVQADSPDALKKKMGDAINSYFEAVLDTDDRQSIPALIERRAPIQDWAIYYLIKCIVFIRQIPAILFFKESIPFHLAHNC